MAHSSGSLPGFGLRAFRTGIENESSNFLQPKLQLSDDSWKRLFVHYQSLRLWNPTVGLISRSSTDEVLGRHYGESIAGLALLPEGKLLDFGSGGGFPGLVLAACRPNQRVILIESRGRKVAFLRQAIASMGLKNCRVFNIHWEETTVSPDQSLPLALGSFAEEAPFTTVSARAVRMQTYVPSLEPLLAPSAHWLAWGLGAGPDRPNWQLLRSLPLGGQRRLSDFIRTTT